MQTKQTREQGPQNEFQPLYFKATMISAGYALQPEANCFTAADIYNCLTVSPCWSNVMWCILRKMTIQDGGFLFEHDERTGQFNLLVCSTRPRKLPETLSLS